MDNVGEMTSRAALQFGAGQPVIEGLGEGLIHETYKVSFSETDRVIVLQRINRAAFHQPENIIHNYRLVQAYLQQQPNIMQVPALALTHTGEEYWIDEGNNFWRATSFVDNACSYVSPRDEKEVFAAARCFAQFMRNLSGLDSTRLKTIIPGFHDLSLRYRQFEEAVGKGASDRLMRATHLIAELRQRYSLVAFYEEVRRSPDYPTRIMHHDCKLSNILFDCHTNETICPVDLDTVMPGNFFSDLGDMIRSMACTEDENSMAWEKIDIRKNFYEALIQGYAEGMGNVFTPAENKHIHHAGLLMIYMQSLRFLADFLNGDIYYKITRPDQNLNRALNQFILLEKLEGFLQREYQYMPYSNSNPVY